MGVMSTTLLRVLSQRRPASVLTQEAPRREELEAVLRAAAGAKYDERPTGWRVVATSGQAASLLAAAWRASRPSPPSRAPSPG